MEVIVIETKAFREIVELIKSIKDEIHNERANQTYLTVKEVCKTLGICQKTFQEYRNKRLIPFYQIGSKIYVKQTDLISFMEDHLVTKETDNEVE